MTRAALLAVGLIALLACRATAPPPAPAPDGPPEPAPAAAPMTWTWTGLEYFGPDRVSREDVLAAMPVALGDPYVDGSLSAIDRACGDLGLARDLGFWSCASLRYLDGRAFLLVDLLEPDEANGLVFRDEPEGPDDWPDEALIAEYRALAAARAAAFEAGAAAGLEESFDGGYLTWTDPTLAAHADELAALAPPHREALVTLALTADRIDVRADAATLLNWAGDHGASAIAVADGLRDPDLGVRNDVSRYLLRAVRQVDDAEARARLAAALVAQAQLPEMSDRNKALIGLLHLAEDSPEDHAALTAAVAPVARRVGARSILPNVGGVARQLLAVLGQPPPRPPADAVRATPSDEPPERLAWLDAWFAAVAARDLDAARALLADDVEVFYVDDAGAPALGTSGGDVQRDELAAWLEAYPTVRSEASAVRTDGTLIWFVERVTWEDDGGVTRTQASEAVYDVRDGRLRRAWYLPSTP